MTLTLKETKDLKILEAMVPSKNIIPNNNFLLKIFCSIVIIILILLAIGHYAFKNGKLTCDNYLLNTYLYVILAIVLIFMFILLNDKYGMFYNALDYLFFKASYPLLSLLCIFILGIILTFILIYIPPEYILASNAVWLLLILLISFILTPVIYFGRVSSVIGMAILITIILVIATGILGLYYGDMLILFDWDYYLMWALIAFIIIYIIGIFIVRTPTEYINFIYIMSFIGLLIFILLLISYFNTLKHNAQKCVDGISIPNYPLESWSLIIKIVNIFGKIIRILGIRKMRS